MRKPITCPLTGHLETVELEQTALGFVVDRCSRFSPSDRVTCTRECARRLDRAGNDELTERVLVLYADATRSRPPADALASALREEDMVVELAAVDFGTAPPPQDYDALVLVAPLRMWGYARSLTDYMREHVAALETMPTWFISVSRGGVAKAERLWSAVGWCPPGIAGFDSAALEPRAHELARMISDDIPALDRAL
ncbi:MAG TPA: flavodoxin domain-containing protein [Kofleriaceae bacterium]|nr:flavodoxin domain-containing protein [Kofleriaceae bacterium]